MKDCVEFFNGIKMPIIGLGTFQRRTASSTPEKSLPTDSTELEGSLEEALKVGYRLIDTAFAYANENEVGKVLKKWLNSGKAQREELFVVTKLPIIGMKPERVEYFIRKSLTALQLNYVDLYLIHEPVGVEYIDDATLLPMRDGRLLTAPTDHVAIWKEMENLVDKGLVKSIGLSNFNEKQIERILKTCRIQPANLQIEIHAYFQQKPMREFCKKHNITICAYAPFGSPGRKASYEKRGMDFDDPGLLENEVVGRISKNHNKSPGQILLNFLACQGIVVIPKSVNPERLKSNFKILDFELSAEELEYLNNLDKGAEGRTFTFQIVKKAGDHPEIPF